MPPNAEGLSTLLFVLACTLDLAACGPEDDGGLSPLCQTFGEKSLECFPEASDLGLEYFAQYCVAQTRYASYSTAACQTAIEDWLACLTATDCETFKCRQQGNCTAMQTDCQAEAEAADFDVCE